MYINITYLNGTELLIDKNLRQLRIMMLQDKETINKLISQSRSIEQKIIRNKLAKIFISATELSSIKKSQLRKEYLDITTFSQNESTYL